MEQRKIKFRAWDKERNIMIGSDYPKNWGNEKDEYWADNFQIQLESIEDISQDKRFNVMQFTGLLDRHGKEIYEGDIVKDDNEGYAKTNLEVRWVEMFGGYRLFDRGSARTGNLLLVDEMEIIGNIYENPELIK